MMNESSHSTSESASLAHEATLRPLKSYEKELENIQTHSTITPRRMTACSVGRYHPQWKLVEVVTLKGKLLMNAGFIYQGRDFLFLEEAVYLMELGFLEICVDDIPISLQFAWWLLSQAVPDSNSPQLALDAPFDPNFSDSGFAIDAYTVYSKLRGLGYAIFREQVYSDQFCPEDEENEVECNLSHESDALDDYQLQSTPSASHSETTPSSASTLSTDQFLSELPTEEELAAQQQREIEQLRAEYFAKLRALVKPFRPQDLAADIATTPLINRPVFHCWVASRASEFKRSCPAAPDFCLLVYRFDEPPPSVADLVLLRRRYAHRCDLKLRFAVVANADVMFFDLSSFNITDLSQHTDATLRQQASSNPKSRIKMRRVSQKSSAASK